MNNVSKHTLLIFIYSIFTFPVSLLASQAALEGPAHVPDQQPLTQQKLLDLQDTCSAFKANEMLPLEIEIEIARLSLEQQVELCNLLSDEDVKKLPNYNQMLQVLATRGMSAQDLKDITAEQEILELEFNDLSRKIDSMQRARKDPVRIVESIPVWVDYSLLVIGFVVVIGLTVFPSYFKINIQRI